MTSAIGNAGFTLLELLVVLAILVLMAGAWPFAAPRLFPAQQLRNEAQYFVSAVRAARTSARVTGAIQEIEFQAPGSQYRFGSETHQLPSGLLAHIRGEALPLQPTVLKIYPDGSSSGGIVDLTLPNRTVSVIVGRLSSRTEIVE